MFAALLDPEAARCVTETYVLRLPDETYSVQLRTAGCMWRPKLRKILISMPSWT